MTDKATDGTINSTPGKKKLRPYWWRDPEFEDGSLLRWCDQCAAERARRTARQLRWDYVQQRAARRRALEVFSYHAPACEDPDDAATSHRAMTERWPHWDAVAH